MTAAARVVSDTQKYDRGLTSLLHDKLHWHDVAERVQFSSVQFSYFYSGLSDQCHHKDH